MTKRPKRYGGMTDREREESEPRTRQPARSPWRGRHAERASEASGWEREESLNDEDLDTDLEEREPRR